MHLPRTRPSGSTPSTYATDIPASQAQALERRHLLDQQQRTFQGTQPGLRDHAGRRRPPA